MKAAKKDFGASNNSPWLAEVTLYLDGTAFDLSAFDSFAMHVKTNEFDPEPQVTPTVTLVAGGSNNVLRIEHALDDDLQSLWGLYTYDVIGLDADGDPVDTVLRGTIDVCQGVTVVA